jgi:DeoR/GlpR family transcriptional regulator of sugar metabolism
VVVADSSKFNRQTLVRVADLDEIERVITDDGLDPDLAAAYGDRVQRVPVEMSLYGDGDDGAATAAH